MEKADQDGKLQSRVRSCIDAVRCVVSVLMAVVTLGVIGGALFVSVRPGMLDVSVANGYVSVSSSAGSNSSSPSNVTLSLTFRWLNPSGRADIQYSGTNVILLLKDVQKNKTYSLSEPPDVTPYSVPPNSTLEVFMRTTLDKFSPVPSRALVRRLQHPTKTVVSVSLTLSGSLKTQVTGGLLTVLKIKRKRVAKYNCSPLTVVGDGGSPQRQLQAAADQDVGCTENDRVPMY